VEHDSYTCLVHKVYGDNYSLFSGFLHSIKRAKMDIVVIVIPIQLSTWLFHANRFCVLL